MYQPLVVDTSLDISTMVDISLLERPALGWYFCPQNQTNLEHFKVVPSRT